MDQIRDLEDFKHYDIFREGSIILKNKDFYYIRWIFGTKNNTKSIKK
jgi:hypothetical protein